MSTNPWKVIVPIALVVALVVGAASYAYLKYGLKSMVEVDESTKAKPAAQSTESSKRTAQPVVDETKLPLGDAKYSASPQKGSIYSCQTNFNGGGAFQAGPWINQKDKTWDATKKVTVDGSVTWPKHSLKQTVAGANRTITTNALPAHITGVFPIAKSDDAYTYDRNPNAIKTQNLAYTLPVNPSQLPTPVCLGGEVGVTLAGVPMFSGFDAGGRDAQAWEVQDSCDGHPQLTGEYHYHGYSDCMADSSQSDQHSILLGYALDGFGLFGRRGEGGKELSTAELDDCHGHSHDISWDGKTVKLYHYHLTRDFPYSAGCFRGQPIKPPR